MNKQELIIAVERATSYDDNVQVVFMDKETAETFTIEEVIYEAEPTDGDGNPIAGGSTLFLVGTAQ